MTIGLLVRFYFGFFFVWSHQMLVQQFYAKFDPLVNFIITWHLLIERDREIQIIYVIGLIFTSGIHHNRNACNSINDSNIKWIFFSVSLGLGKSAAFFAIHLLLTYASVFVYKFQIVRFNLLFHILRWYLFEINDSFFEKLRAWERQRRRASESIKM